LFGRKTALDTRGPARRHQNNFRQTSANTPLPSLWINGQLPRPAEKNWIFSETFSISALLAMRIW
jgi:hypothetical protein